MTYKIKISLLDLEPEIWRIIEINSDAGLLDLHAVIQTAMGWTNSHLHHFIKNNVFYALPTEGSEDLEYETIDEETVKISDIISKKNEKIIYEYDFGDGWEHIVELLEISEKKIKFPKCLDGGNACPPEDCGGVPGYENLLEVISDPENEEYEDMIEWLGGEFEPSHFNVDEANKRVKKYRELCDLSLYLNNF